MKELFDLMNFDISFPITDPTWIFFLVLVIILFAPIVLERLRIPHIIGELYPIEHSLQQNLHVE